jgi:hypothetical protein
MPAALPLMLTHYDPSPPMPSLSLRDHELVSELGPPLELTAWTNLLRYNLFQDDDLICATSESLAHVANLIAVAHAGF